MKSGTGDDHIVEFQVRISRNRIGGRIDEPVKRYQILHIGVTLNEQWTLLLVHRKELKA